MSVRPTLFTSFLAAAALAVLTGCGAEGGELFDNEAAAEVTCMTHQSDEPGERYTDPALRNTGEVLMVMRYYTENGAKPYCDGEPASDTDRAWGDLYLQLSGTEEKIPTVLG